MMNKFLIRLRFKFKIDDFSAHFFKISFFFQTTVGFHLQIVNRSGVRCARTVADTDIQAGGILRTVEFHVIDLLTGCKIIEFGNNSPSVYAGTYNFIPGGII